MANSKTIGTAIKKFFGKTDDALKNQYEKILKNVSSKGDEPLKAIKNQYKNDLSSSFHKYVTETRGLTQNDYETLNDQFIKKLGIKDRAIDLDTISNTQQTIVDDYITRARASEEEAVQWLGKEKDHEVRSAAAKKSAATRKRNQANKNWLQAENDAVEAFNAENEVVKKQISVENQARKLDNLSLEAEGAKNSDTIVSNVNNVPVDQQTPIKNLQKYDSYSSPDGLPNPNNTPPAMDIFGKNGKAGYSGAQTPISNGATIANTSSGGPKITLTQQEMDALATGNGDPVEIMKAAQARATKAEQAATRVSSAQNLGLSQESQNIADLMLEAEGVSNAETIVTGPGKFVKTSQEAWNNQWGGKKKVIEKANDEFAFGVKHAVGAIAAAGGLMTLFSSTGGQQNNAQLYGQQPLY